MTETDLRLLAVVLREARELAMDCENESEARCSDCMECCGTGVPSGNELLDALDQFKFRASFDSPE